MIHIVSYVTDTNHGTFRYLQKKLDVHALEPINGLDANFYDKSLAVSKYIKTLNLEDIIVVLDGYDVIPSKDCSRDNLEYALCKYFNINQYVVFNAETNCFPDWNLSSRYSFNHNSKWKYLNAGLYAGKVKNVKRMMDSVLHKINESMDQLEFAKYYLDNKELVLLDNNCCVFQTLYDGKISGDINWSDFVISNDNIITNKYFNTTPMLFHGNGKINMGPLAKIVST